ncbi:uncharacterized protein HMPREF1541_09979 [Cyphellophora europaea CBS 101466]|uniref:Autophagy-related protein 16 domain-containing protein n=1 Tax=Cyphellophora europaea (strain CBS 101466) TaxID=1220924 RepID=W2SAQ2_CYPE1|nr:uncharacterized protein HMPREF1541_09979 [Cyphellophora europaea CBS 101466]ETN45103.1 hypothetical protein HMPREF1541_09979 [Cyphellophora europaea CBS 101466]
MAADWKDQYLAALKARDAVEKVNVELYDHYNRLADQKAELQKHAATTRSGADGSAVTPLNSAPIPLVGFKRVSSPPPDRNSPSLAQMRQELARAQQERADLQMRLETGTRELNALKSTASQDTKKMSQLSSSVKQLTLKLRDRDEELKGKAKLLENVQDENVTLNLQLNMAEEQQKKLKKENQELVDRWMTHMGKEADRMNDEHKFG